MNLIDLIDTRQGTNNQYEVGRGNTLSYTGVPFGMNHFVLQTQHHNPYFYQPNDASCYGFRLTHQPSPWMGDFAYLTLNTMLLNDEEIAYLQTNSSNAEVYSRFTTSGYRPKKAKFKPHVLSYQRLRDQIELSLIPTTRGASIKADISSSHFQTSNLVFSIAISKAGHIQINEDSKSINGYTNQLSGSKYGKFGMYFYLDITGSVELISQTDIMNDEDELTVYWYRVKDHSTEIDFDISTSYISHEQAILNHQQDEFFKRNWDQKYVLTEKLWLEYLTKIEVSHENIDYLKTFYTCLYRTATFPQIAYEYDENQNKIHYSPYTFKVEKGAFYTNNGYWDTFRSNYPLYSLIIPEKVADFIEGIYNVAKEDQYLPKWLSPDERGLMPGTLVDAVIADAISKELVSTEMTEKLLDAMIFNASTPSDHELEGREGVEIYDKLGYLPTSVSESVNKTLDYAYSDFCIATVAEKLDHKEIADKYYARSKNYQHLFNAETNLMMPRKDNGDFLMDFDTYQWGDHYTEGSAWQNSLSVFHDIQGLIELYKGDEAFYSHLSELINSKPIYHIGGYGKEIHEMIEMASVEFGQLAFSNQPAFHIPYLFNYCGYPNVTQQLVKSLMTNLFHHDENGFVGDEDNGSMSSWYVLSSLGLYSVTPGKAEFNLGIALWDKATIHTHGQKVEIMTENNEAYLNVVTQRSLNGETYTNDFITYKDLIKGAVIKQRLGSIPSIEKTSFDQRPFSLSQAKGRL